MMLCHSILHTKPTNTTCCLHPSLVLTTMGNWFYWVVNFVFRSYFNFNMDFSMFFEVHGELGTRRHYNWPIQNNEKCIYCCISQHQSSVVSVAHHEKSPRKIKWIDQVQGHKAWFEVMTLFKNRWNSFYSRNK